MDDQEPEKTKRLLGIDRELHTPGMNAEETSDRKEALGITELPINANINARRMMLKWKKAHGSGQNLDFPCQQQINDSTEA